MQKRKSFKVKKIIVTIVMIGLLLGGLMSGPAIAAEDDLTYKKVYLSVRPEYDQPMDWFDTEVPAVLVINQVEVVNNSTDPITRVSYPAPIDEANFSIFAVGKLEEQGRYIPAPHILGDGQIHIDFSDYPINPQEDYDFVVQYYYTPLVIAGANKSFDFSFAPDFTVDNLLLDIDMPPAAKNIRIDPIDYGMGQTEMLAVNQDNPINIKIAYDKADNIPTHEPFDQHADHNHGESETSVFFIIFIVALIAAVGLFIFMPKKTTTPKQVTSSKQSTTAKQTNKKAQAANPASPASPAKSQEKSARPAGEAKATAKESQQKELRKMLIAGEITEKEYKERINKL